MRIGFDAKRAFFNTTGLGNYSRTLIGDLFQVFPDDEYYFFTPKTNEKYENIFAHGQVVIPRHPNPIWRSYGIHHSIRQNEIDVYHGLSNELPFWINFSGKQYVVNFSDIIFIICKVVFL